MPFTRRAMDGPLEPPEADDAFDIGVIGLGPAGIVASTELTRYGHNVVACARDHIGGLIRLARRVENFPGIPPECPGTEVIEVLWEHLRRFPPVIREGEVANLYNTGVGFGISVGEKAALVRCVILATGTNPVRLGLPGEDLPWVKHAWTDISAAIGSKVAVIGGGDLAVDQALSLHDGNRDIEMLLRSEAPVCNRALLTELEEAESFNIHSNCPVLRFEEDAEGMRSVVYSREGVEQKLEVEAVLVSIGREPSLPDLNGMHMSLDRARSMAPQGVFVCGDLVAGRHRQVAIAAGNGLDVAMRCSEYLRGLKE